MSTLDEIFEGYYEKRMGGEKADPEGVKDTQSRILEYVMKNMEYEVACRTMESISEYGMYTEKAGFIAGFKMAWDLIKEMQG